MTDCRLWCLLLCLLVGAAACKRESAQPAAAPAEPAAPAPAVQKPGPDAAAGEQTAAIPALAVTTVDGKPWSLADHRGRWVVVNFWATWCAPCLKEMPDLSALDAMREHIEVIGLAYEDTTAEDMRAFLKDHPVVYPIALLDVYDPPKDFATPRGLPTTYLIAPDGRVAKHFLGPITAKDIEGAIAAAGGPKAGVEVEAGKASFPPKADLTAATPYGDCPKSAQFYQDAYTARGNASDLVCHKRALERELK